VRQWTTLLSKIREIPRTMKEISGVSVRKGENLERNFQKWIENRVIILKI
jgi:hypothetical protein